MDTDSCQRLSEIGLPVYTAHIRKRLYQAVLQTVFILYGTNIVHKTLFHTAFDKLTHQFRLANTANTVYQISASLRQHFPQLEELPLPAEKMPCRQRRTAKLRIFSRQKYRISAARSDYLFVSFFHRRQRQLRSVTQALQAFSAFPVTRKRMKHEEGQKIPAIKSLSRVPLPVVFLFFLQNFFKKTLRFFRKTDIPFGKKPDIRRNFLHKGIIIKLPFQQKTGKLPDLPQYRLRICRTFYFLRIFTIKRNSFAPVTNIGYIAVAPAFRTPYLLSVLAVTEID